MGACAFLGLAATVWSPSVAVAQSDAGTGGAPGVVDVVQVSGYLDPILADFITEAVRTAARDDARALIIQLDSPGSLLDADRIDRLGDRLRDADVPVVVWVGDSRAEALGGAAELALAADLTAMAPGARLGDAPDAVSAELPDELRSGSLGPEEAHRLGLLDLTQDEAAVLRNVVATIDGMEVDGEVIETAQVAEAPGDAEVVTMNVQTRLWRLPLGAQLMHTAASPPVAFLLLSVALSLLVFEFFTAGVGIAGVVGAASLALAGYGLAVLPTSPLGLALCVLGIFGFAVDVQTGVPRVWTGVGVVAYALGALMLFGEGVRVGWLPLVAGVVGVVLIMLAGLPATVRSRFSTPTIGRESMIGELGEAAADIAPEGTARIRDALWPARTNRATPITTGDPVRVVAIEGTVLEVEPKSGGARDYRRR